MIAYIDELIWVKIRNFGLQVIDLAHFFSKVLVKLLLGDFTLIVGKFNEVQEFHLYIQIFLEVSSSLWDSLASFFCEIDGSYRVNSAHRCDGAHTAAAASEC